ncbi:MAG: PD40 domain-containing protein [Bacteroidales bacterium]|nr:PD40 domain-containing protein [Bacteroidales bacterium]
MIVNKAHTILLFLLAATFTCAAQTSVVLERQADAKLKDYDFAAAQDLYRRAYDASSDAAFRNAMVEKMAQCDNGLGMLSFACKPVVVAKKTVPAANFFQYYKHIAADRWGRLADGTLAAFDPSLDKMFFERRADGQSDIYTSTRVRDSLWSAPELLGSSHMSSKDEVMPIVSYDGKKLYYSSKGLFGMGGYDLFVCQWDEASGNWGEPQNLGFPFSSVGDDFLYSDTPDGNFTIFASNRDCGADSVTIYVLAFKNEPLKTAVSAAEARRIAALEVNKPQAQQAVEVQDEALDNADPLQLKYAAALAQYQDVKDSIAAVSARQADLRSRYAASSDESERGLFQRNLASAEQAMFSLQQQLRTAAGKVQAAEMECLQKGVSIDPSLFSRQQKSKNPDILQLPDYEFLRLPAPGRIVAVFEQPEEQFDYTFRVEDEAVIAESNDVLNEGLVYQIQIVSGSSKLAVRQLRGLSPVFEKRQSNGRYTYCVGKFPRYADAQKALPTVKRYFSSAYIVAFRDGKSMSVANARKAEAAGVDRYQVIFSEYPDGIPADVMQVIRANSSKDIARRTSDEGKVIYYIAPFDSQTEAESLAAKLRAAGAKGVSTDTIK